MINLYLDESGEDSFSTQSIYKHLLITIVRTNEQESHKIKNHLKRIFTKELYDKRWDKSEEIKASTIYNDRNFGGNTLKIIFKDLMTINSLEINYIIVKKDGIVSESLKKAPYGIVYNYFTGQLISKLIFEDKLYNVNLIFDKRNKETHENKPFKEYLKTLILGKAFENNINVTFLLDPKDSNESVSLKAADFFSWGIFRKFEYADDSFFKLFEGKINKRIEWYT